MAITIHTPDHSPAPTQSPFPGYPVGVRPLILSAVCADPTPANVRHHECSLPACVCTWHAPRLWEQQEEVKDNSVEEAKQEEGKAMAGTEQLHRLVRLGTNRDS